MFCPAANAYNAEQSLLKSLSFQEKNMRLNNIPEAHATTFSWIFDETATASNRRSEFVRWLRSDPGDNSIFWIGRKPGSGKSTLMKYLYSHKETVAHLRQWAGTQKLAIGSHFFWSAGSSLQKTQEGLLRTLHSLCIIADLSTCAT
jgi:hypothetical protein